MVTWFKKTAYGAPPPTPYILKKNCIAKKPIAYSITRGDSALETIQLLTARSKAAGNAMYNII